MLFQMQNLLNIAYFQGRMEEIVRKDILSALKEAVSLLSEDEIDFTIKEIEKVIGGRK